MSATGLESLEHTLELTRLWINDLDESSNGTIAYRLLKSVLHALRDLLQLEETAHFGAQLPTLLPGAYYEAWRHDAAPASTR